MAVVTLRASMRLDSMSKRPERALMGLVRIPSSPPVIVRPVLAEKNVSLWFAIQSAFP